MRETPKGRHPIITETLENNVHCDIRNFVFELKKCLSDFESWTIHDSSDLNYSIDHLALEMYV